MAQAASQQDGGEYVTKAEFEAATKKLQATMIGVEYRLSQKFVTKDDLRKQLEAMEGRLMEAITYTNNLNEQILDQIKPDWNQKVPLI